MEGGRRGVRLGAHPLSFPPIPNWLTLASCGSPTTSVISDVTACRLPSWANSRYLDNSTVNLARRECPLPFQIGQASILAAKCIRES